MKSRRLRLYLGIKRRAGIGEGQIVPRWLRVVRGLLWPRDWLAWVLRARGPAGVCYNGLSDVYTIGGLKISLEVLVWASDMDRMIAAGFIDREV